MEISYWQSRWQKEKTGWHMDQVYPPLKDIWPQLSVPSGASVLIPFCGKSLDMKWLSERGQNVVGVDVSRKALREFLGLLDTPYTEDTSHGFTIYRSPSIELWEGDFLKLPVPRVKEPAVIYDKASIVALPQKMRPHYAQKILELCGAETQILLQTFEYNQDEMTGPPFSVKEDEIRTYFEDHFAIEQLHEQSKLEELSKFKLRGLSSFLTEKIFLLRPKNRK